MKRGGGGVNKEEAERFAQLSGDKQKSIVKQKEEKEVTEMEMNRKMRKGGKLMHPKLLERFKCESKMKIMEGVGVRSLVRNTLEVIGAFQSFGMGTRTNDKWVNYSYGHA